MVRSIARHVILLTLITAVICADRTIAVLPAMNQTVAYATARAAAKLAENYRRTTREFPAVQYRAEFSATALDSRPTIKLVVARHSTFSAFQFRLPPPTA